MKKKAILINLLALSLLLISCEDGDFSVSSHSITYVNYDGTVLYKESVSLDMDGQYKGEEPTKEATDENSFKFSGWSEPTIDDNQNVVYKAEFFTMATVTFKDYNNNTLYTTTIEQGCTAVYAGKMPERDLNGTIGYKFINWDKDLTNVQVNFETTAQYKECNTYKITFVNYDNTVLETSRVFEGDLPVYGATNPTKPDDGTASYDFTGWSPEITTATEDKTYIAQYTIFKEEFDTSTGATANYKFDSSTNSYYVEGFGTNGLVVNIKSRYNDGTNGRHNVTKIYIDNGFYGKEYNQTINVPSTIEEIRYRSTTYIKGVNVSLNNPYLASVDGAVYSKDLSTLFVFPASITGEFTIPEKVRKIDYCFMSSLLSKINIGENLESLYGNVFSGIDNLTNINVDENNKYFSSENGVLFNKDKTIIIAMPIKYAKTTYTLPNTVIELGDNSFTFTKFKSLIFDEDLEKIGSCALNQATLGSLDITKNVNAIDYSNFINLKTSTITVDEENKFFVSVDNVLYSYDKKSLIQYPSLRTDEKFIVPNFVEEINRCAFWTDNLKTLIITSGVKKIDSEGIVDCQNIKDIYIPKSVTTMENISLNCLNNNVVIHCEVSEKPTGWNENWHNTGSVLWGEAMPTE